MAEFKGRIKQKRDTEANWKSANPTPLDGEIVIVTMTDGSVRIKIGDGKTKYASLAFADDALRNTVNGKLAANLGASNAGKLLSVGNAGAVAPTSTVTWGALCGKK